DGNDLAVTDDDGAVLDHRGSSQDATAGDGDVLSRCGTDEGEGCNSARKKSLDTHGSASSLGDAGGGLAEAGLTQFESGYGLVGGIGAVEGQTAVDEDLIGAGVDREGISAPDHHVGALAGLQ